MLTRARLRDEMAVSERQEEETYKRLTLSLFRGLRADLQRLYDETAAATAQFSAITADAIRAHPRSVKTLRYCLCPVISQMRLGQIIDLPTTDGFEEHGVTPTDSQAERLAAWFNAYLDRERFAWLDQPDLSAVERTLAEAYAKRWTVSLQANQNTLTEYRTKRKELQEDAISAELKAMGLIPQTELGPPRAPRPRRKPGDPPHPPAARKLGGIDHVDDLQPGHFVTEKKILGGSQKKQKADLTARPSDAPELYCLEAKAVGIRLDSTKRLKELSDKYTDWKASSLPVTTVGVVAGMFSEAELVATIKKREIPIFFEHNLTMLREFLSRRFYYGTPWSPSTLFEDVPTAELDRAFDQIQTAPVEADPVRAGD